VLAEVLRHGLPPNNSPLVIGDDYVLPAGYNKPLTLDVNKLHTCPPDEWLVVQAWDMS